MLDFDTVVEARPVLDVLQGSPSNKNAIVFAVASQHSIAMQALENRAHFVLQRPIDRPAITHTLYAAYDFMRGERRRYFRCAASLNVQLSSCGDIAQCLTINVSSNGLAINTGAPRKLGSAVDVSLQLPDGSIVEGNGLVIWDDKHGKTGVHFHCKTPQMRIKLDHWLDMKAAEEHSP
jgi:hypothetical protein